MSRIYNKSANDTAPAVDALAVTPNDGTDLANGVTRALYIGTAGDLSVVMVSGVTISFSNVPVGILPIAVTRVRSSGTSALGIVALY